MFFERLKLVQLYRRGKASLGVVSERQGQVRQTGVPRSRCYVRPARFDDHEQIAALQSAYGLKSAGYEQWKHLWADNPASHRVPEWPIGWVVENSRDQIVGYIGNVLRAYELGDRSLAAACGYSLVVDSNHRGYAVSLASKFFNQKHADLIINNTVGPKAAILHELFHCARVPTGIWNQSAFWVTDYPGFAAGLLAATGAPFVPILTRLLALSGSAKDRLTQTRPWECPDGVQIEVLDSFDERFEEFWEELKWQRPHILLANRSQAMLKWQFDYALAQRCAWAIVISSHARLLAYATFHRDDNAELRLKRVHIVDFQTLHGPGLLAPMLFAALQHCRREGVHMLEAIGFRPETQRVIDSMAPYKRTLPSWSYLYRSNNPALTETLRQPQTWDPTAFDGDASVL